MILCGHSSTSIFISVSRISVRTLKPVLTIRTGHGDRTPDLHHVLGSTFQSCGLSIASFYVDSSTLGHSVHTETNKYNAGLLHVPFLVRPIGLRRPMVMVMRSSAEKRACKATLNALHESTLL